MKMGKWVLAIAVLAALTAWGCGTSCPVCPPGAKSAAAPGEKAAAVFVCGSCGQIKGADVCCAEDAEVCDKCGLAKGSPGCCKIEKGDDVKLCADCGQIAGSDVCCAEDAEKCSKCGLAKGSPGCCKIKI